MGSAGHVPALAEAEERMELVARRGPTPEALAFRRRFPPPGAGLEAVDDDRRLSAA